MLLRVAYEEVRGGVGSSRHTTLGSRHGPDLITRSIPSYDCNPPSFARALRELTKRAGREGQQDTVWDEVVTRRNETIEEGR